MEMGRIVTFETLALSILTSQSFPVHIIDTDFNFLDQFNFSDCCRNCFGVLLEVFFLVLDNCQRFLTESIV